MHINCCCYCCLVDKLCLTLCASMGCSPISPSVHGIFQARILECSSVTGVFQQRIHFLLQEIFLTQGSNLHLLLHRQILYHWTTREGTYISVSTLSVNGLNSPKKKKTHNVWMDRNTESNICCILETHFSFKDT